MGAIVKPAPERTFIPSPGIQPGGACRAGDGDTATAMGIAMAAPNRPEESTGVAASARSVPVTRELDR